MNRTEEELLRAVDEAVFGTSEPNKLKEKLSLLETEFQREQRSLGSYLESLRRGLEFSLEEMAKTAGVPLPVWKDWEMDFCTPSPPELVTLFKALRFTPYQQDIIRKLWSEAPRFRLKRMTGFRGEFLAARGVASESGLAWLSVDESTRELVREWGCRQGYDFPKDLLDFLRTIETDEDREAWVVEILGS